MAAEHTLAPAHAETLLNALRWQAARREESRGEVAFLFEDALVEVGANVIFNRRDVVDLSGKLQAAVAAGQTSSRSASVKAVGNDACT